MLQGLINNNNLQKCTLPTNRAVRYSAWSTMDHVRALSPF
jgi:hypothetical protein